MFSVHYFVSGAEFVIITADDEFQYSGFDLYTSFVASRLYTSGCRVAKGWVQNYIIFWSISYQRLKLAKIFVSNEGE